jgi:hypothetical protein
VDTAGIEPTPFRSQLSMHSRMQNIKLGAEVFLEKIEGSIKYKNGPDCQVCSAYGAPGPCIQVCGQLLAAPRGTDH